MRAAPGWRSVLEVLIVAAADSAAAVVNQALDALQPVIAALYAGVGVGHQHFLGIVTAVAATMRSPFHAELSISAVHVMQSVAQRLAQSDPEVSAEGAWAACGSLTGVRDCVKCHVSCEGTQQSWNTQVCCESTAVYDDSE